LASLKLQRPSSEELAVVSASTERDIASLASRWSAALYDETRLLDVHLADLRVDEAANGTS
jgi:hypothetical protein